MKMREILKMNSEELENKVVVLHRELFDLRFQLALGKLTNTAQIRKLKKSIARIKTILTQKKITSNANLIQPSKPSKKTLKISLDNVVSTSTSNDDSLAKQEVNLASSENSKQQDSKPEETKQTIQEVNINKEDK